MTPSDDQDKALSDFVARHVTPYDPATDAYGRLPFSADILSEGRSAFYNFHYYHTKVPPEVIRDLIRYYTSPGDVVLDPFCGSGMTGLGALLVDYEESLRSGRSSLSPRCVILNELSPAACHIAANYNSFVEPEAIAEEFARISAKLEADFNHLYSIEHYEPAVGSYDAHHPEVAARLTVPQVGSKGILDEPARRNWELLSREEVEARLQYPVTTLAYAETGWNVRQWLAIPATMHYAVWSDVFKCQGLATITTPTGRISKRGANVGSPISRKVKVARGCGGLINLWDCAVNQVSGEISDSFVCPHCGQEWTKIQLSRSHSEPVEVSYRFDGLKQLKRGVTTARISRSRPIGAFDREQIAKIDGQEIPDSFTDEAIDVGREMMRHGLLKRGVQRISEFYTHRNLYGLSLLWGEISALQNGEIRKKLQFCFTSQVMRASRLRRMRPFGPGEQLSGTLYIAAITVETNVLKLLSNAVSEYCDTFPRWMLRCPHKVFVRNGSATNLGPIPDSSIDFVITDPPFGKNIFYADCAMLWENWLQSRTDESMEIVINERRVGGSFKTIEDYGKLMESSLREMYRVLKPGRHAVVEFNNSDGAVFEVVKRAITEAGFRVEGMFVFDKGVKTFKQYKGASEGEAVVDKDVMFTLAKPSSTTDQHVSEEADLEQEMADAVREHLLALPERIKVDPAKYSDEHRTTATINSMLMNTLIPKGVSVERLSLPFIEQVCSRYFRKVGQHWYLRGEAVGNNGDNGLIVEEVAVRDEVTAIEWLRQKLEPRPMLIGELKPLWMRATGLLPADVSQALVLENLLAENFWRDLDTNRWREPTDDEREKMNDDRSLRVLHDAERFVAGTLNRQTTDEERCQWIDVLFQACRAIEEREADALPALRGFEKADAYTLIPRVFQSILKDSVSAEAYDRAQKQSRAASTRLARQAESRKEDSKDSGTDGKQTRLNL